MSANRATHVVPMSFFEKHYNPYKRSFWKELFDPITQEEVERAVTRKLTMATEYPVESTDERWNRQEHAARIAFFVLNEPSDPVLELDIGVPELSSDDFRLTDGHHRLAALMFLEREEVLVSLSGSLGFAEKLGFREIINGTKPRSADQ
jgi:hypothetical protein